MAIGRTTAVNKSSSKTLADFPGWVEANRILEDLRSQHGETESRLKAELAVPRDVRITQDAALVLAGGDVAVQVCDVDELRRRRDVLTAAIGSQEKNVEMERRFAAKEITTELLVKQRETIERFIEQQDLALTTYDEAAAIFASAEAACGGAAGLPELGIPSIVLLRYRHDFARFKSFADQMLLSR